MANRRESDDRRSSSPVVDLKDSPNSITGSHENYQSRNVYRGSCEAWEHSVKSDFSRADTTRREENPFSLRHFLRRDTQPNYSMSGARPKVYSPARMTSSEEEKGKGEGTYPCNPTELPDFVQDHLVIEQCYLSPQGETGIRSVGISQSSSPLITDVSNLPDFALNGAKRRHGTTKLANNQNGEDENEGTKKIDEFEGEKDEDDGKSCELPFVDLTGGLERRNRQEGELIREDGSSTSPYPRPQRSTVRRHGSDDPPRSHPPSDFPFDLPSSLSAASATTHRIDSRGRTNSSTRGDSSPADRRDIDRDDVQIYKTLPDFLNDGPIRNRVAENVVGVGNSISSSISNVGELPNAVDARMMRLARDDAFQHDMQNMTARRDDANRMRVMRLNEELDKSQAGEAVKYKKALERMEIDLKRNTLRATHAEDEVALLKNEMKTLTAELNSLRIENRELRHLAGAGFSNYQLPNTEGKIKKLSEELRTAATSAENSLRQLMAGVSNLKSMATALENIDRIEDRTKDFMPDFDEENAAGPAL